MIRKSGFILIFFWSIIYSSSLMGQGIEDLVKNRTNGAYVKKITLERKPAPLPGIREADVTWSKTVWRWIDFREKMNQVFYFPTHEMQGRNNLFNVLMKGIKENAITAFVAKPKDDNEFGEPISYDGIAKAMSRTATISIRDFNTGLLRDSTVLHEMSSDDVKILIVKEIWYFDKQKSSLQVRILGICPVKVYFDEKDVNKEDPKRLKLFWVYYPEVRALLAKSESLNSMNGARNLSYDDLFLMRYFDGYIFQEENVFDNREIRDYASNEYALEESNRIKNAIFNYEQDLWEY
jgi:gliding motility associated protien GldN